MAWSIPGGISGPYKNDAAQPLLYKIACYLAGAITGEFGLLVRGNVSTEGASAASSVVTGFTSGLTASQQLLAANTNRLFFTVDNRTGVDLYYKYGLAAATTAVGGYDIRVPAGFSVSEESWKGPVQFICAAGAAATGVNVTDVTSA
jgi:hypothetical protein